MTASDGDYRFGGLKERVAMDDWLAQLEEANPRISPGGDSYFIFGGCTVTDLRRPCSAHSPGTKVSQSNCYYLCPLATVSDSPRSSIFLRGRGLEHLAVHGLLGLVKSDFEILGLNRSGLR
jgi:hypothetical protein